MATSGVAAVLIFAGCGSSASSSTVAQTTSVTTSSSPAPSGASTGSTAQANDKVPYLDLAVDINGLERHASGAVLPQRFTCDGANVSPPIRWGKVPPHTVEIDLFLVSIEGETEYTQWAVAGLSPSLKSISTGQLPPGAIVGRNRYNRVGYSLCPAKGSTGHYAVLYFPLPARLSVNTGFDPHKLVYEAVHAAPHEGQLFFSYTRRA